MLVVRGSESVFRIMETNDFKQLPHITLAFRPGNDAAVKQVCGARCTSEGQTLYQSSVPVMLTACCQLLDGWWQDTDSGAELFEVCCVDLFPVGS